MVLTHVIYLLIKSSVEPQTQIIQYQ